MEYKFEGKTALVTGAGKGELTESLLCAAAALGGLKRMTWLKQRHLSAFISSKSLISHCNLKMYKYWRSLKALSSFINQSPYD